LAKSRFFSASICYLAAFSAYAFAFLFSSSSFFILAARFEANYPSYFLRISARLFSA
jgi:hypothetical protein